MIQIKIQCGCGQCYAFDVEPVDGRMPWAIACPVCGIDGTAAADAAIGQDLPAPPAAPAVAAAPFQVAVPAQPDHPPAPPAPARPSSRPRGGRLPGQMDHNQAVTEAKAKMSWGDTPQAVISFLMIQGFSHGEASELVQGLYRERVAVIRRNGMSKIFIGCGLVCVPIVAFLIFLSMGVIPMNVLTAIPVMIGCWGLWMVVKGIFMVLAPKSERGDVAEQ